MRKAFRDVQLIEADNGNVVGVNLGYDFCSEHEWGIKGIKSLLGVPNKSKSNDPYEVIGIEHHLQSRAPELIVSIHANQWLSLQGIIFHTFTKRKEKYSVLLVSNSHSESIKESLGIEFTTAINSECDKTLKRAIKSFLKGKIDPKQFWAEETLLSSWDSDGFILRAKGEDAEKLQVLHQMLIDGKAAVGRLTDKYSFGRGGIVFMNSDCIDDEEREAVKQSHLDHNKLIEAFSATGIEKQIEDAGLRFYALKPQWANEEKTELVFWLNPCEQQKYNSGWMTLEDLQQWCQGTGKIIATKEKCN